jgi:hypothetical protein
METKPYSLQSPEEIAKQYGGNKQKIAQATQSGLLDPTAAVMAGMFIDRMRNAQMEEQAPAQTVAQDILAPQQMQQPQQPQQMQQPMPQSAGLEALPVPDQMFDGPGMAGGGLVAFSKAGVVDGMTPEDEYKLKSMFPPSITQYNRRFEGNLNPENPDRSLFPAGTGRKLSYAVANTPMPEDEYDLNSMLTGTAPSAQGNPEDDMAASPGIVAAGGQRQQEQAPPQTKASTAPAASQGSALDEYARMLMGSLGDRETSKEDAKNMALLQAGLGIMGGVSDNAFENIARGALPATQAYQQQMAAGRKEERETIGALADLELKAKELGLTEKRYGDLVRIAEMQVAAAAGKSGAAADKTLLSAQINLAKEIMNGGMVSAEQAMAEAARLIGSAGKDSTDTKAAIKYVPGKGYVANQ